MKINKNGIIITAIVSLLSIIGTIFINNCWWQNFCFAILGSSLVSFMICIISYNVAKLNLVEELVINSYRVNIDSFTQLYSVNKNKSLEEYQIVLGTINSTLYNLLIGIHEFRTGLFFYNEKNKNNDLYKYEYKIQNLIENISSIGYYIEFEVEDALKNTKKLYSELDKIISDNSIYLETISIANKYGSSIKSFETNKLNLKIKKTYALYIKSKINETIKD